jgi:hypothetical protein
MYRTRTTSVSDPDPHSIGHLDPDPHKVNADPKHCVLLWFISLRLPVTTKRGVLPVLF